MLSMTVAGEVLVIENDTSLPALQVLRVPDRIIEQRGKPRQIRVNNGPEFTCSLCEAWYYDKGITQQYMQPDIIALKNMY